MSDLIPNYKWDEIRKLSFEEISQLPCCEITGEPVRSLGVFLMMPRNDFIKSVCDYKGQQSNSDLMGNLKAPGDFKAPLYVSNKPKKSGRVKALA